MKRHTERDMRLALGRFASVRVYLNLLKDDDEPGEVLNDVISEVLELRAMKLELTQFMQQFQQKWKK